MEDITDMEVEPLQNAKFVKPYRLNYTQNGVRKTWEVISVHPSVAVLIYNTDRKKLVLVRQFRPAVYFSNFSRQEREPSSGSASPTKSIAIQSIAPQSTQTTQTLHQSQSTQETQTAQAASQESSHSTSTCLNQSTQSTQSASLQRASQSTQSDIARCHQSSQSDAAQPEARSGSALKKLLPPMAGSRGVTLEMCAGIVDKRGSLEDIAKDEVLEECGYDISTSMLQRIIAYRAGVGAAGDLQTLFYVEVTDAMKVSEGGGLASEGELIEVAELTVAEARSLLQQEEVLASGGLVLGLTWFLANKQ